jgi:hypothetical protein
MTGRYEIRDRHNPKDRGMRFTDLARAQRELARAEPTSRWFIFDRLDQKETDR